MSRSHIHFAKGEPGDNEVISGKLEFRCCLIVVFTNHDNVSVHHKTQMPLEIVFI